ncbi:hypothetical protein ZWY2020_027966 [Hordeum vulgare]|nr:hypothetical protein ZWY2020_027966 [Hordeum vulgare]
MVQNAPASHPNNAQRNRPINSIHPYTRRPRLERRAAATHPPSHATAEAGTHLAPAPTCPSLPPAGPACHPPPPLVGRRKRRVKGALRTAPLAPPDGCPSPSIAAPLSAAPALRPRSPFAPFPTARVYSAATAASLRSVPSFPPRCCALWGAAPRDPPLPPSIRLQFRGAAAKPEVKPLSVLRFSV